MRLLYLDMNCWVQMARGIQTTDPGWVEAAETLQRAVEAQLVRVPLSAAHYLELWHRSDPVSRTQVGALMRDISGFASLLAFEEVQRREISAFVAAEAGRAQPIDVASILGRGAEHAFASPYGRLRFVESVASGDRPEGPPSEPPANLGQFRELLGDDGWDWFQLVGEDDFVKSTFVERTPQHRLGAAYQQAQEHLRSAFLNDPGMRARLADAVALDEFLNVLDAVNEICESQRVDPVGLFMESRNTDGPPGAIRDFVARVPTADVLATHPTWRHRHFTHPWDQHDRTDLLALAVAVPYCDYVVTERRWAHLVRASGLAKRYHTGIGAGLVAVQAAIAETVGDLSTIEASQPD